MLIQPKSPHRGTKGAAAVLMVALAWLVLLRLPHPPPPASRPKSLAPAPRIVRAPKPDLSTLAPGAKQAILRALGPDGVRRISFIMAPANQPSDHGPSGYYYHGHPYGLACDIVVYDKSRGGADARALRLQGFAAWYRGPGSPDGYLGNPPPHLHCVWPGAPTRNPVNMEQISSFVRGYRALGLSSPSAADWQDPTIRPDEIASVRRAYYSMPGRKPLGQIMPYDALHVFQPHP